MATYRQIQDYVRGRYGYTPQTCWIADVKEQMGIPMKPAPNRIGPGRVNPCPLGREPHIKEALQYFSMLNSDQELLQVIEQAEKELESTHSYPIDELSRLLDEEASQGRDVIREKVAAYGVPPESGARQVEWTFSPTAPFRKSMKQLDKTLLGRVLEAITVICEGPTSLRGDTVKPLSGELAGRWRYRVGDYRLIYRPDEKRQTIFLLAISPRSSAYTD